MISHSKAVLISLLDLCIYFNEYHNLVVVFQKQSCRHFSVDINVYLDYKFSQWNNT